MRIFTINDDWLLNNTFNYIKLENGYELTFSDDVENNICKCFINFGVISHIVFDKINYSKFKLLELTIYFKSNESRLKIKAMIDLLNVEEKQRNNLENDFDKFFNELIRI